MNRKNLQNISLNDLDKSEIKEKNENFLTAENININAIEDHAISLAVLAKDSGLDGVVCSAEEANLLRNSMPADFILVTPGIRREQDAAGTQKRVITPSQAIRSGSAYLVVGRPITQAVSPSAALAAFNSEIASV